MTYIFKGMKKKIAVVTVMCMIFTLSMPIGVAAATVSDTSGHWASTTIQSWVDKGLVAGYPDGTFRPDRNISRAEFMTLVNRSYGYTATESISFSDVKSDAWYFNAVAVASEAGYISGYPDGSMKPDNPISREEAATIIANINKLQASEEAASKYNDVARMVWSRGAIGAVSLASIMNGYPDGSFSPQASIKRGETVVTIDRSKNYVARPAAPLVTRNDEANTVSGMTTAMEYKLDSADWDTYALSTFDALVLSGNHTLIVRYEAEGTNPYSQSTSLSFTTNETGGGGGGGGGGDDAALAIDVIEAYATLNTNPAPTVANYTAAGVTGVVAGNLAAVNAAINALLAVDVDTAGEIQAVVNGVVAIIAIDIIEAYATLNTNPAPSIADYTAAGVTGVVAGNLAAVNAAVEALVAVNVDTVGEIQAVVDGAVAVIAIDIIEAYATLITNPVPTVADYTAAGVTGVVAGNLAAVNAAVEALAAVNVDTVGEIQAVVDGAVAIIAIDLIEAYATLNTNPAPAVADYTAAGVTGVVAGNLAAINAAVEALLAVDVDTAGEIQAVVDGVVIAAIDIIEAYATLITNPVPTVADYATAGVSGVVAGNLAAINAAVEALVAVNVDTVGEIQAVVDGAVAIIAIDLIEAYATLNTNTAPAVADYTAAGVTGVVAGNLAAVNAAIDALLAVDVDTAGEIQAVVNGVVAIIAIDLIEAYATLNTNPAPTVADYTAAGVTGVVAGNLTAVNAAVDALAAVDVDTVGEIQAVVDAI